VGDKTAAEAIEQAEKLGKAENPMTPAGLESGQALREAGTSFR